MTWHAEHDLAGVPDVVTLSSPNASATVVRARGLCRYVEEPSHKAARPCPQINELQALRDTIADLHAAASQPDPGQRPSRAGCRYL
jgi:hypothetical protein